MAGSPNQSTGCTQPPIHAIRFANDGCEAIRRFAPVTGDVRHRTRDGDVGRTGVAAGDQAPVAAGADQGIGMSDGHLQGRRVSMVDSRGGWIQQPQRTLVGLTEVVKLMYAVVLSALRPNVHV